MKKISIAFLCIYFVTNISFAFDPYTDEEFEKKSKTKLYCGIAMTLIGGFLAYDGFSQEEVDISKPSVDYGGSINAMWLKDDYGDDDTSKNYSLHTGSGTSNISDSKPNDKNIIYNTGNVDLTNVTVWVRYKYSNGNVIDAALKHKGEFIKDFDSEGYFEALELSDKTLAIGEKKEWDDMTTYTASSENSPYGQGSVVYYEENALKLVDVKVKYDYKKKYKKQNKSDLEGVMGLMVATAGIYFIVDYLWDLHKFNMYMKRNDMKIRLANTPNEYKLVFQKRL